MSPFALVSHGIATTCTVSSPLGPRSLCEAHPITPFPLENKSYLSCTKRLATPISEGRGRKRCAGGEQPGARQEFWPRTGHHQSCPCDSVLSDLHSGLRSGGTRAVGGAGTRASATLC